MYQIQSLPDGSTKAEERRREVSVWSTVGPVGTEKEQQDRGTEHSQGFCVEQRSTAKEKDRRTGPGSASKAEEWDRG
jgi:hypothetical protein